MAGLETYGRPARKPTQEYACEGGIHLLHKVPAPVRRSGMPAAPLAVHKINHSAPPASQQSLHTDLDHAIAACFTRIGHVRFHMKKPDQRRGWGGSGVGCASQAARGAPHPPYYQVHNRKMRRSKGLTPAQETRPLFKGLGKGEGGEPGPGPQTSKSAAQEPGGGISRSTGQSR